MKMKRLTAASAFVLALFGASAQNVGINTTTPIQNLDVNGRMNVSSGVIQKGGAPITNTTDMGLYSQVPNDFMRLVTNVAPIRFYTDGGIGTNPNFSIEYSGRIAVDPAGKNGGTINNNSLVFGATNSGEGISSDRYGLVNLMGLDLSTNRTRRLSITNDGNVGIGTSTPSAKLDVTGPVKIGSNGTPIVNMIKTTVNADVGNVGPGLSVTLLINITNAAANSTVYVSPGQGLANGLVIAYARVSAPDQVEVKFTNISAAGIDPPTMDYYLTIIQ